MKIKRRSWAGWFNFIVCRWLISVCIFLLCLMTLCNWVSYWRSANWKIVDGTIIQLHITSYDDTDKIEPWSGNGELNCQYEYFIDGKAFRNSRIGFEIFGNSESSSRRYMELKRIEQSGRAVKVFVNPEVPAESGLYRESTADMYFYPLLGIFWFGALFIDNRRRKIRTGD